MTPAPGLGVGHVLQGDFRDALGVDLSGVHVGAIGQGGQDARSSGRRRRPSTSAEGSRSAYPSCCASCRASAKLMCSRIILVRIKLVVPFKIPAISPTSLAARHWLMGRMMGTPPPTLASKRKFKLFSLAMASSSAPFSATSSLLEVTTLLPCSRQAFTYWKAGSSPPHDLHHHGDLRVVEDHVKVLGEQVAVGQAGEFPQVQDMLDLDLHIRPAGDAPLVGHQHFQHAGAHYAVAQHRNIGHSLPFLSLWLSP